MSHQNTETIRLIDEAARQAAIDGTMSQFVVTVDPYGDSKMRREVRIVILPEKMQMTFLVGAGIPGG